MALWGAITGSIGAGLAARREILQGRRRLAVVPGIHYSVARNPVHAGAVTHAWAFVMFWNTGGRDLAVERVGFRYFVEVGQGDALVVEERDAAIHIEEPIAVPVDAPSARVSTPVGPLLIAGLHPAEDLVAYAGACVVAQSPPADDLAEPATALSRRTSADLECEAGT